MEAFLIDDDEENLTRLLQREIDPDRIGPLVDRMLQDHRHDLNVFHQGSTAHNHKNLHYPLELPLEPNASQEPPLPVAFQGGKGEELLRICRQELHLRSSVTVLQHAMIVLSSRLSSSDMLSSDDEETASQLASLLDSSSHLPRDVLIQYHGQRTARIACLTELLRLEQEDNQAAREVLDAFDGRARIINYQGTALNRGIFHWLLAIISQPLWPHRPGSSREALHFARNSQETRKKEALEALLVLLYKRIDGGVTIQDFFLLCDALQTQDFFAADSDAAHSVALILICCSSLWCISTLETDDWSSASSFVKEMYNDPQQLDAMITKLELLHSNIQRRRNGEIPESLAILSTAILFQLSARSIREANMGVSDKITLRLESFGNEMVDLMNGVGALEYFENLLIQKVGKASRLSGRVTELGASQMLSACLGKELISAIVICFQDSILSTELDSSCENIGILCRLISASHGNSPLFSSQFWEDWISYKEDSDESGVLPLCSVLDAACLLAKGSMPTDNYFFSPETVLRDTTPLLTILAGLSGDAESGDQMAELLPYQMLKGIFQGIASNGMSTASAQYHLVLSALESLARIGRIKVITEMIHESLDPRSIIPLVSRNSYEIVPSLTTLVSSLVVNAPSEWKLEALELLGFVLRLPRAGEVPVDDFLFVDSLVDFSASLWSNLDEVFLSELNHHSCVLIFRNFVDCIGRLLSSLSLLARKDRSRDFQSSGSPLEVSSKIFDHVSVVLSSLSDLSYKSGDSHMGSLCQMAVDSIIGSLETLHGVGDWIFLLAVQPVALVLASEMKTASASLDFLVKPNSTEIDKSGTLASKGSDILRKFLRRDFDLDINGSLVESFGWIPPRSFSLLIRSSEAALGLLYAWTVSWSQTIGRLVKNPEAGTDPSVLGPYRYLSSPALLLPTLADREVSRSWPLTQISYMNLLQVHMMCAKSPSKNRLFVGVPHLSIELVTALVAHWLVSPRKEALPDPNLSIDIAAVISLAHEELEKVKSVVEGGGSLLSSTVVSLLRLCFQSKTAFIDRDITRVDPGGIVTTITDVTKELLPVLLSQKTAASPEFFLYEICIECLRFLNLLVDRNHFSLVHTELHSRLSEDENERFCLDMVNFAFGAYSQNVECENLLVALSSEALRFLTLRGFQESPTNFTKVLEKFFRGELSLERIPALRPTPGFKSYYTMECVKKKDSLVDAGVLRGLLPRDLSNYALFPARSLSDSFIFKYWVDRLPRVDARDIFRFEKELSSSFSEIAWIRRWQAFTTLSIDDSKFSFDPQTDFHGLLIATLKGLTMHSTVLGFETQPSIAYDQLRVEIFFRYCVSSIQSIIRISNQIGSRDIGLQESLDVIVPIADCCEAIRSTGLDRSLGGCSLLSKLFLVASHYTALLTIEASSFSEDAGILGDAIVSSFLSLVRHSIATLDILESFASTQNLGSPSLYEESLSSLLTFLCSVTVENSPEDFSQEVARVLGDSTVLPTIIRRKIALSEKYLKVEAVPLLHKHSEVLECFFDFLTSLVSSGSRDIIAVLIHSDCIILCGCVSRIIGRLNDVAAEKGTNQQIDKTKNYSESRTISHTLMRSMLRYLYTSLRSCRDNELPAIDVELYLEKVLLIISPHRGVLKQCVVKKISPGLPGNQISLYDLSEAKYLAMIFCEINENDILGKLYQVANSILEEFSVTIKSLAAFLCVFLGCSGASRELFRVLEGTDRGVDFMTDISPVYSLLMGGNSRHEAIRFSYFISSYISTKSDDERNMNKRHLGPWSRRASEDALDPQTVGSLERQSRLSVTSEYQFKVEAEARACLFGCIRTLWLARPTSRAFVQRFEENEDSSRITSFYKEGTRVSFLSEGLPLQGSSSNTSSVVEYGQILGVDTYGKRLKIRKFEQETTVVVVPFDMVTGMEDPETRRNTLALFPGPDSTSDVERLFDSTLSTGHLIFLLRWCHQYLQEMQETSGPRHAEEKISVKILACQVVALLVHELNLLSDREGASVLDKANLTLHLLDLFGGPEEFGKLFGADSKHGRMKLLLSDAEWTVSRDQISTLLAKAKNDLERKPGLLRQYDTESSGNFAVGAGPASPFRAIH